MKLFAINDNEGNAYEFFDKEDNKIHPNNKRIIVVKEKIYLLKDNNINNINIDLIFGFQLIAFDYHKFYNCIFLKHRYK